MTKQSLFILDASEHFIVIVYESGNIERKGDEIIEVLICFSLASELKYTLVNL